MATSSSTEASLTYTHHCLHPFCHEIYSRSFIIDKLYIWIPLYTEYQGNSFLQPKSSLFLSFLLNFSVIAREQLKVVKQRLIWGKQRRNILAWHHVRFMTLSLIPYLNFRTMPNSSSRGISILGVCRNTYFRYKWISESFISCRENFWPMHDRGPRPKGIKA